MEDVLVELVDGDLDIVAGGAAAAAAAGTINAAASGGTHTFSAASAFFPFGSSRFATALAFTGVGVTSAAAAASG